MSNPDFPVFDLSMSTENNTASKRIGTGNERHA